MPKPDDRKDNVDKIQQNIDMTLRNMELADELVAETSDPEMREALKDKNERRRHALESMRGEIKDEAKHRERREED
ncbi:MAG: small acid-soluble spore protein Tlp [Clostridiales bacterium]|nr:small acid-soluble spore protein Tlp [Clostridiales bacterium]